MNNSVYCVKQAGVSLVEVLVAVVIFSFGSLGILGLQTATLRYQNQSDVRAQALLLGSHIVGRMRANAPAIDSYVVDWTTFRTALPNDSKVCNGNTVCTNAEVAARDLYDWRTVINQTFLNPGASISKTNQGYIATVTWTDSKTSNSPACTTAGVDQVYCCPGEIFTGLHCVNTFFNK